MMSHIRVDLLNNKLYLADFTVFFDDWLICWFGLTQSTSEGGIHQFRRRSPPKLQRFS
jgi:hypothetical protein